MQYVGRAPHIYAKLTTRTNSSVPDDQQRDDISGVNCYTSAKQY